MNRSYFKWVTILAIVSVLMVPIFMWNEARTMRPIPTTPIVSRPQSPYDSYIAALGVVEARTGNIFIGSPVNRVVEKIEVKVGQKVKEGDVLFKLEAKDLEADLISRQIVYENAKAKLNKLESLPRPEDVVTAEAQFRGAELNLQQAKGLFERVVGLQDVGAMSHEEVSRRHYLAEEADAKYQQAKAELEKVKAGAWLPDLEIAKSQVQQSKALVQRTEADIARTIIRSPTDATVLQIKIHEGEFPPTDSSRTPPMIIGNTDVMHLRVNINQFDASFYNPNSPAVAFVQGNATIEFPLKFVNLEPYLVNKQSLTSDITEQVDTRVLQAIYCFEDGGSRIYVGQQMDVFIKTHFPPTK